MIAKTSMILATVVAALFATYSPVRAQDELTCEDARCLFQQEITGTCSCEDIRNHGQYVKCVGGVVRKLTKENPEFKNCRGKMIRCAARSTCGKPGFVTCNAPGVAGARSDARVRAGTRTASARMGTLIVFLRSLGAQHDVGPVYPPGVPGGVRTAPFPRLACRKHRCR